MSDRQVFSRFHAHLLLMDLEDVRHSCKCRETRRTSAERLMHQTRIMAQPTCSGTEIPVSSLHIA